MKKVYIWSRNEKIKENDILDVYFSLNDCIEGAINHGCRCPLIWELVPRSLGYASRIIKFDKTKKKK